MKENKTLLQIIDKPEKEGFSLTLPQTIEDIKKLSLALAQCLEDEPIIALCFSMALYVADKDWESKAMAQIRAGVREKNTDPKVN